MDFVKKGFFFPAHLKMWKAATNTARPCASVWKGHLEYCNYSKSNLVEDHKHTIVMAAKSKCTLSRQNYNIFCKILVATK